MWRGARAGAHIPGGGRGAPTWAIAPSDLPRRVVIRGQNLSLALKGWPHEKGRQVSGHAEDVRETPSPPGPHGATRAALAHETVAVWALILAMLAAGCAVERGGTKGLGATGPTDSILASADDGGEAPGSFDGSSDTPWTPGADGEAQEPTHPEGATPCTPTTRNGRQCGCGLPDTEDLDGDGTTDCSDDCPRDANKVAPGQCGCGNSDLDGDDDGIPDCVDDCPADPGKRAPEKCGCGTPDRDSDDDGLLDCMDGCPADTAKDAPGACGCGVADVDTDGDGTLDCMEQCPAQAIKLTPGVCGCDVPDVDSDGDGTVDCHDGCPGDAAKLDGGQCGCGVSDDDRDNDGVPDCMDGCPKDKRKVAPGVCGCGERDEDDDGDGTLDCDDECPKDSNKVFPGICGCGERDGDRDGDGTADCLDPCPDDIAKVSPGICGCGFDDPLDPSQPCPGATQCTRDLAFVDTPDEGHALCQGDCDDDDECAGNLRCFHTSSSNDSPVPGCAGEPRDSIDYCYDPVALDITLTVTAVSEDPADDGITLGECQGLCEVDDDCEAGLECWENNSSSELSVPGCLGTASDGERFCIDPARSACPGSP